MRVIIFAAAAGTVAIIAALAFLGVFAPAEPFPVPARIHYYRNPAILLNNIDLKVFYVLPAGAPAGNIAGWVSELDESFRKIVRFHGVQFLGKSLMQHEIVPEPLILENIAGPAGRFDKDLAVLNAIATEAPPLANASPGHYTVSVFVFEGNGFGGAEGLAYVPAALFREGSLRPVRESVIYRAIGHALGIPDGNDGVMGAGTFRPLEMNFIEPELMQKMGLLD